MSVFGKPIVKLPPATAYSQTFTPGPDTVRAVVNHNQTKPAGVQLYPNARIFCPGRTDFLLYGFADMNANQNGPAGAQVNTDTGVCPAGHNITADVMKVLYPKLDPTARVFYPIMVAHGAQECHPGGSINAASTTINDSSISETTIMTPMTPPETPEIQNAFPAMLEPEGQDISSMTPPATPELKKACLFKLNLEVQASYTREMILDMLHPEFKAFPPPTDIDWELVDTLPEDATPEECWNFLGLRQRSDDYPF